jgi:hypothetical protein
VTPRGQIRAAPDSAGRSQPLPELLIQIGRRIVAGGATLAAARTPDGRASAFPGAGRADTALEGQKRDKVGQSTAPRLLTSRSASAEEIVDEQTVVIRFQHRDYTEVSGRALLHALGAGGLALCGQAAERLAATGSEWDAAYLPHVPRCRGCMTATGQASALATFLHEQLQVRD